MKSAIFCIFSCLWNTGKNEGYYLILLASECQTRNEEYLRDCYMHAIAANFLPALWEWDNFPHLMLYNWLRLKRYFLMFMWLTSPYLPEESQDKVWESLRNLNKNSAWENFNPLLQIHETQLVHGLFKLNLNTESFEICSSVKKMLFQLNYEKTK